MANNISKKDKLYEEKLACLARELLTWSLKDRRAFIARAEKRHGEKAGRVLMEHLIVEFEKRKKDKEKI